MPLLLAHNIVNSQSTSTTVVFLPQDQSVTTVSPSSHETTMNDDFVSSDANITFESPRRYQLAVAIGLTVLGGFFLYLLNGRTNMSSNEQAAQILGALLLLIGVGTLLYNERTRLEIDPLRKTLTVRRRSIFGEKKRLIALHQVTKVGVMKIGSNRSRIFHYLPYLVLQSGEQVRTGFSWVNESEAYAQAKMMAKAIGCPYDDIVPPNPSTQVNLMLAGFCAVAVYMIYYRWQVGPFCPAMWFGTAPIFIMAMTGWCTFTLLQRWRR
jgi:hypothetical protein